MARKKELKLLKEEKTKCIKKNRNKENKEIKVKSLKSERKIIRRKKNVLQQQQQHPGQRKQHGQLKK